METFLLGIQPTIEGLRDASAYIMETCADKREELVAAWINAFNAANASATKQLTLFYVVNEVFQRSQRQFGTVYLDAFLPVLPSYVHRFVKAHPELVPKIARVVDIWEERRTLNAKHIKDIRKAIGSQHDGGGGNGNVGGGKGNKDNHRVSKRRRSDGDDDDGGDNHHHKNNNVETDDSSRAVDELLEDDDILGGGSGSGSLSLRRASSNSNLHVSPSAASSSSPPFEGSPSMSGSNHGAFSPSAAGRPRGDSMSIAATAPSNLSQLSPIEAILHGTTEATSSESSFDKLARLGSSSILPLSKELTEIFEELNESDRAGVMDELIAEKYERAAATVYKLTKALATQRGVDELRGAYESLKARLYVAQDIEKEEKEAREISEDDEMQEKVEGTVQVSLDIEKTLGTARERKKRLETEMQRREAALEKLIVLTQGISNKPTSVPEEDPAIINELIESGKNVVNFLDESARELTSLALQLSAEEMAKMAAKAAKATSWISAASTHGAAPPPPTRGNPPSSYHRPPAGPALGGYVPTNNPYTAAPAYVSGIPASWAGVTSATAGGAPPPRGPAPPLANSNYATPWNQNSYAPSSYPSNYAPPVAGHYQPPPVSQFPRPQQFPYQPPRAPPMGAGYNSGPHSLAGPPVPPNFPHPGPPPSSTTYVPPPYRPPPGGAPSSYPQQYHR